MMGRLEQRGALRFVSVPCAEAEGYRVAIAGYLADRATLAETLHPTRGAAADDAELVALAYRRWGNGTQAHLLGEYAFALFDPERGTLLLGHDALGLVPLFFSERGGVLTFGTDLAELVGATGAGELDEDYLADCFAGVRGRDGRTPYGHISRLMPGTGAVVRNGAVATVTTFDPAELQPLAPASTAEYAERLRELVTDAVASALPATGTVWSDLSGGLDSSTVVSVAAGTLGASLEAISLVFGRSHSADESDWIDAVLATYPIPSHRIDADTVPPFSSPPDRFHPEPTGAPIVAALNGARDALLAAHGVGVVLTGACGDAVFFGDSPQPYFLADGANPFAIAAAVRRWEAGSPQRRSFAYWFERFVAAPRLRRLAGKSVVRGTPFASWLRPEYARRMQLVRRRDRRRIPGLRLGDEYYWNRIAEGALITSTGQYRASASYAHRNPLLYLPLVSFMGTLPWPEKMDPGADRELQRRALRGILPERTRLRRGKRGPVEAIFGGLESSRAWVELLTRRSALVERGYADPAGWREAVNRARAGGGTSVAAFLQACALEAWFATLDRAPATSRLDEPSAAARVSGV